MTCRALDGEIQKPRKPHQSENLLTHRNSFLNAGLDFIYIIESVLSVK